MTINWFFLSSLTLSIASLFLIFTVGRFGRGSLKKTIIFFYLSVFIWAVSSTIISATINQQLSESLWRIGCVGVTFTPFFFFKLSQMLSKLNSKSLIFSIYILGVLFSVLLLISDLVIGPPINNYYKNFLVMSIGPLYFIWFFYWIFFIFWANFILYKNYLHYSTKSNYIKETLKYFSPGFIAAIFNFLNPFNFPLFQIANFGIAIFVLSFTYLIIKNTLPEIEIIYRKGIIYSFFIAALTSFYLLLIMFVELIFRSIIGYKSLILSLFSAFALAFLFNPLRNHIQYIIERYFLGKTPKEIKTENEYLKQALERSERLKTASTLALGLAHEVRNPLTTIKTFAEYLPEKYKDDEFVAKFSRIIPSEVERINSIIKQLLDFSKPTPPAFLDTNIYQLLNETLTFLNSEFLKKHIKIERSDENQSLTIKIDPSQFKQALLNIVLNAIDAMPKGGVLTIATEINNDNYFRIKISDTGHGIPKDDLKNIFDPFFSKKDSGTGLGLSIAHNIIKNHNGFIEVESELGKGTTFVLKLPLERSEE